MNDLYVYKFTRYAGKDIKESGRGTWYTVPTPRGDAALLRCPECDYLIIVMPYNINLNGSINRQIICVHHGCTFKSHVILDDWENRI